MARNCEIGNAEVCKVQFLSLVISEQDSGGRSFQAWAVLPDGRYVLVGTTANKDWAVGFTRMIPTSCEQGEITAVIVETTAESNRARKATIRHSVDRVFAGARRAFSFGVA